MSYKYIYTDVEVSLDEWDTDELIDELKDRASNGDEDALKFIGPGPMVRSAAEILSDRVNIGVNITHITPQDVINAPGYGSMAIANADRAVEQKAREALKNG